MKAIALAALASCTLAGCAETYPGSGVYVDTFSPGLYQTASYDGGYYAPRHRRRYAPRHYYRPSYSSGGYSGYSGGACHGRTTETGDQRPTEGLARRAANKAWAQAVRARFGEQYTSIGSARGVSYRCFGSSVNGFLKRCELSATPCRAR